MTVEKKVVNIPSKKQKFIYYFLGIVLAIIFYAVFFYSYAGREIMWRIAYFIMYGNTKTGDGRVVNQAYEALLIIIPFLVFIISALILRKNKKRVRILVDIILAIFFIGVYFFSPYIDSIMLRVVANNYDREISFAHPLRVAIIFTLVYFLIVITFFWQIKKNRNFKYQFFSFFFMVLFSFFPMYWKNKCSNEFNGKLESYTLKRSGNNRLTDFDHMFKSGVDKEYRACIKKIGLFAPPPYMWINLLDYSDDDIYHH